MLILGGSATVTALTGMNTIAACFLIPLGVCIYVSVKGLVVTEDRANQTDDPVGFGRFWQVECEQDLLVTCTRMNLTLTLEPFYNRRATLIADYSHTAVLFAILLTFAFSVYTTSPLIGSTGKMWDLLLQASEEKPIVGNAEGSYLTMRSKSGLIFGVSGRGMLLCLHGKSIERILIQTRYLQVLNIVGNFGTGTSSSSREDSSYSSPADTYFCCFVDSSFQ